jgi:O-antigen/teichoic acid export membrane protein
MAADDVGVIGLPDVETRRGKGSWRHTRHARRRLGWGVADQAVSSLTNFALNIYIVRHLGAVQYGAFALAYVTYGFALQASRGLATDPLLVRYSGKDLPTWRRAVSSAAGTATLVGLVGGVLVLVTAAFLSGPTRMALLALGVTLPLLMLQDSWRFAFFALGRGSRAFLNDSVWAVSLIIGLAYFRSAGLSNVFWYVFAWGAAAGVGAAVGLLQTRVIPKVFGAREWLSRQRDLGFRYLVEGASYSAAGLVRNYGIGLILGLTALGYIQAASTLMGPFQVILYGLALATLPEAIRILQRSPRHMMLFCVLCSVGLTLVALAWGITLLVALPRGLGQWLLGPIWRPTYELVLPTTFFMMGGCVSAGAATYMRALGAARRSVRAAIFTSIFFLVGSLVGAIEGGAVGAVVGAAAAAFLGSLAYWWQLRAALRETHGIPIPEKLLSSDRDSGAPASSSSSGTAIDVTSPTHDGVGVSSPRPAGQRLETVRRRLVANAHLLVVMSPTNPSPASPRQNASPEKHLP